MKRRDFLRNLGLATGAVGLVRPGWLRALDADPWYREFHAALAEKPWLAGWKNIDETLLPERDLRWRGKPPRGLAGTLYRNGPARFERDGLRYRHWFDGDGLVQAWRMQASGVTHRARMVATPKFQAEQAAGRFERQAAGTWIANAKSFRNSDDINVANTSVIEHAGRLYALWEGGSAWELDADTLRAKGPRIWRDDLQSVPFSAHPLRDVDGSLWNFGLAAYGEPPMLLAWRIGADGELASITPIPLETPGYLHSFAMTERHLIFVVSPWLYDREAEGAFFERMRWRPEQGCEVIVLAKDALDAPMRHRLPGGLAFHFANAYERHGQLVMHGCWYDHADAVNRQLSDVMRGRTPAGRNAAAEPLVRIEVPLKRRGEARLHRQGPTSTEFPAWDTRYPGPGGRLYLAGNESNSAPYLDSVLAWDTRRERIERFHYGEGWLAEEHLFVAKSPTARRDEGWLIGTALDTRRDRLCLSVFDARHIDDGPICQATLPRTLPLGFHGHFVAG